MAASPSSSSFTASTSHQLRAPLLDDDDDDIAARSLAQKLRGNSELSSDSYAEQNGAAAASPKRSAATCCGSPVCPSSPEAVCLTVVVVVILAGFSVPLFLHYLLPVPTHHNCTNLAQWVSIPTGCAPLPYNHSGVCSEYLTSWQSCANSGNTDGYIFVNTSDTGEMETKASSFMRFITNSSNISVECKTAVVPFICQYLFPICNASGNASSGDLLLPSQEACMNIREHTCGEDFLEAAEIVLVDCGLLPRHSQGPNITCAEGFFNSSGTCQPSCYHWNQFGPQNQAFVDALTALVIMASFITVVSSLVLFVISAYRHKIMLRYPTIYIIFMTFGFFAMSATVLVGQFDRLKLYCSYPSVTESLDNPSLYCIVSGAVFQYFVVNSILWWLFHICSVLYKLAFPVFSNRKRKYELIVHIMLTVVGCLSPLPGVVLSITQPEYRYYNPIFPPVTVCVSRDDNYWFNSIVAVVVISCAVGLSMLVIIVWLLRKYQRILKASPKGIKLGFTIPEVKLLFVFFFYVALAVVIIFFAGITLDQSLLPIDDDRAKQRYFDCEADGYVPGRCFTLYQAIQDELYPKILPVMFIMLGSVPLVNLIYVINWKYLKSCLQQCGAERQGYQNAADQNDDTTPVHTNRPPTVV